MSENRPGAATWTLPLPKGNMFLCLYCSDMEGSGSSLAAAGWSSEAAASLRGRYGTKLSAFASLLQFYSNEGDPLEPLHIHVRKEVLG